MYNPLESPQRAREVKEKEPSFRLNSKWYCVNIDYPYVGAELIDTFRINCGNLCEMGLQARYWFARRFPGSTHQEKVAFHRRFWDYCQENKQAIESLSRQSRVRKREALLILLKEIEEELRISTDDVLVSFADEVK